MTEYEILVAQKHHQSRIVHSRFKRKNLLAEKKLTQIKLLRHVYKEDKNFCKN